MTPEGTVSTVAGKPGQRGSDDGIGEVARFAYPVSIAVDGGGNLYVGEPNAIRKISPGGEVTTLAGKPGHSGSADGTGSAARFGSFLDVAVDRNQTVYVFDGANYTIRRVTSEGVVTTLAGAPGLPGSKDGVGSAARFSFKGKIAVDPAGNCIVWEPRGPATTEGGGLEILDRIEPGRISRVSPEGVVTTLIRNPAEPVFEYVGEHYYGYENFSGYAMPSLRGLAIDGEGNLYASFADDFSLVGRGVIQKLAPSGSMTTLAGSKFEGGSVDASGADAQFALAGGLDVDARGNVFLADAGNNTIRRIAPDGSTTTIAGTPPGNADGTGNVARFRFPAGLAADPMGHIYVADTNIAIRKITPDAMVSTLLTPRAHAVIPWAYWSAQGLTIDGAGNFYLVHLQSEGVRKVTPEGAATTFLTFPRRTESNGSSFPASPSGIAADPSGNIYVALSGEHTIRKITPAGVAMTLAGSSWVKGSEDGIGGEARFSSPVGVALDSFGTLYVADSGNSTIRRITADGVVTTLAGKPGESGSADGAGSAARFVNPRNLAIDRAGNLFVVDNDRLRKIADGAVTTLSITTSTPFDASSYIMLDAAGNIYLTHPDHTVSKGVLQTGAR